MPTSGGQWGWVKTQQWSQPTPHGQRGLCKGRSTDCGHACSEDESLIPPSGLWSEDITVCSDKHEVFLVVLSPRWGWLGVAVWRKDRGRGGSLGHSLCPPPGHHGGCCGTAWPTLKSHGHICRRSSRRQKHNQNRVKGFSFLPPVSTASLLQSRYLSRE